MRRLILFLALAASVCACKPKLVILHTNDTHSHFEPVRSGEDAGLGGVIERAAFVDSVRARYGSDRVLLVHAGDFNQGTPYYSELGGVLEPRVINEFGYDCITLGNHEFDNGIEDLCRRLKMLERTTVVCANLDLSQFELGQYVKPCTVVEKAGMKIGIIGLETDLSTNVSKTTSSRIPQLDSVEVTNRWADYLKNEQKCDIIIVLSHMGYEEDLAIIPQTRHLDMIIGGHTHTFVDELAYAEDADGRKVGVITDGCWGLQMGELKLW